MRATGQVKRAAGLMTGSNDERGMCDWRQELEVWQQQEQEIETAADMLRRRLAGASYSSQLLAMQINFTVPKASISRLQ
jgi:hypothetical protein